MGKIGRTRRNTAQSRLKLVSNNEILKESGVGTFVEGDEHQSGEEAGKHHVGMIFLRKICDKCDRWQEE